MVLKHSQTPSRPSRTPPLLLFQRLVTYKIIYLGTFFNFVVKTYFTENCLVNDIFWSFFGSVSSSRVTVCLAPSICQHHRLLATKAIDSADPVDTEPGFFARIWRWLNDEGDQEVSVCLCVHDYKYVHVHVCLHVYISLYACV